MKYKILIGEKVRFNVPETNSSSVHSMSVGEYSEELKEKFEKFSKEVSINFNHSKRKLIFDEYTTSFGWGYEEIQNPYSIWNYLIVGLKYYDLSHVDNFAELISGIFDIDKEEFIGDVLAMKNEERGYREFDEYIDHQSIDNHRDIIEMILESASPEQELMRVLFNSILIISNDNEL